MAQHEQFSNVWVLDDYRKERREHKEFGKDK